MKRIIFAAALAAASVLVYLRSAEATVPTTCNRAAYTGNGATTVFAFPCKFLATSDLIVTVDGVVKTLTTHYTVTGAQATTGGNVTFLAAPANATAVVIRRSVPFTQPTSYRAQGSFRPETHETSFDRATMLAQQANRPPAGDAGVLQVADGGDGFAAYAGASCAAGQYATALSADGGLTCATGTSGVTSLTFTAVDIQGTAAPNDILVGSYRAERADLAVTTMVCRAGTQGVPGVSFNLDVFNESTSATLCTVGFECDGFGEQSSTCGSSALLISGDTYGVRVSATSSCGTDPDTVVCTVQLTSQ